MFITGHELSTGQLELINTDYISLITTRGDNAVIYTSNKTTYTLTESIEEVQKQLGMNSKHNTELEAFAKKVSKLITPNVCAANDVNEDDLYARATLAVMIQERNKKA